MAELCEDCEEERRAHGVSLPAFTLLREKLTITHSDPIHRKLALELHIRYDGVPGTSADYFVMILKRYLPGLEITDDHDRQLSFLPYHEIEKRVGVSPKLLLRRKVGLAGERAGASLLWITLPEKREVGQIAIIRLNYGDSDPPGKRESLTLIRSPRFKMRERKGTETWNTFIEVEGPPGTEISFSPRSGLPPLPEERFDGSRSGWRNFGTFAQVRAIRGQADVAFTYRLRPFLSERLLIRGTFAMLTILPLVLLVLSFLDGSTIPGAAPENVIDRNVAVNLAGIGIPAMLAITALLPATAVNRLWYGLPLALYLLVLLRGVAQT